MKVIILALMMPLMMSCSGQGPRAKTKNKETVNKANEEMKTIKLTKEDFLKKVADNNTLNGGEWKYLGDKPAIIDFYADWCGPCRMIAPVLEELAAEYGDQIYIYKVDTQTEEELSYAFGIRSIPSLLFIPMEGAPQMKMGAMAKSTLKKHIDEILLNKDVE